MNHGKALGVKALLVLPVLWIVLTLFFNVSFMNTLVLGIVLILIAYALGDMVIFPRTGNMVATISDFALAFLVIWIGLNMIGVEQYGNGAWPAFLAALFVAVGEFFYHKWLAKNDRSFSKSNKTVLQ